MKRKYNAQANASSLYAVLWLGRKWLFMEHKREAFAKAKNGLAGQNWQCAYCRAEQSAQIPISNSSLVLVVKS